MKFTKDMTIAQVLRTSPDSTEILSGFGMHCFGCPGATAESLEQAAQVHGFDVEVLLAALNQEEQN